MSNVSPGKTQIPRKDKVSLPTKAHLDAARITGPVLHHGRGQAYADSEAIRKAGHEVTDYEPFPPANDPDPGVSDRSRLKGKFPTVLSNYVGNVVRPEVRGEVWRDIANSTHPKGQALVTVRGTGDGIKGKPEGDGVITAKGTFQKPYTPKELHRELSQHFGQVEILSGSDRSASVTARATKPKGGN